MFFDPSIIKKFADMLYDQADAIVLRYTVLATLFGLVVGFGGRSMILPWVHRDGEGPLTWIALGIGVVAAFIGRAAGNARAFSLRLQAQIALCQVQIEENTRPRE